MRYPCTLTALLCVLAVPLPARSAGAKPKQARVTYDEHLVPILREKCFACHNQDRKSGGLRLNTYANVMAGGASGEVIKAGDPDNSRLYKLVAHQQEPFMPPKSPMLPQENVDVIKAWIAGGALENAGSKAAAVNRPKLDLALPAVAKGKPAGPPPMPGKLRLEPVVTGPRANAVTALACSPWAPLVAVGGQHQVLLYHADTLDFLGVLPFPEGVPQVLKFSRNGSLLLAGGGRGGKSGRVVVWGVKTGERVMEVGEEYDAVLAADMSSDQTQIALGGPSKIVRIYSTRDGKLLHEIKKHTDWVTSVEFSPDGVLLATGDRNGGLFVWEAFTAREYFSLRGHTAAIKEVSWRSDSNVLASASEDGSVRFWEMENGGNVKTWGAHAGGVEGARFGHDSLLVSCGRDRTVRVWDPAGNPQRAFEPFADLALSAAFTHDGARVVAGDWTGQVRAWATADGRLLGQLPANPPSLAQQLEAAGKELAARKAERDRLAAAADASKAAADRAAKALTAAQRHAEELSVAAQAASSAVSLGTQKVRAAESAVGTAQARVGAQEVVAHAFMEAAAKVQEAAAKSPANPELAERARWARQVSDQANAELEAFKKKVTDEAAALKAAQGELAAAQASAQKAAQGAAGAASPVTTLAAGAKAAADRAAADKAAADRAAAAYDALVQRWSAALAQVKQPAPPAARR